MSAVVYTCTLSGKAALKRVFLGIGWAATPGQRIDVDCCCAPYAKGVKVSADTVWYGNLRSRDVGEGAYKGYCTVKHSGDVLIGQQSSDDDGSGGKKQGLSSQKLPATHECQFMNCHSHHPLQPPWALFLLPPPKQIQHEKE